MVEAFDAIKALLSTINSDTNTHIREFRSFRNQVEDNLMSLREDLSSLNVSVSNLSMCLQEHKQQTTVELAQLQTSLNTTQSSVSNLQSSLTTHTQQVNAKLNNLTASLSQHQQQTAADAQQLNSTLNTLITIQQCDSQGDSPTPTPISPHTCGGTGGWRRVVYLDMTDPSTTCPCGWNMTGYSKRTCGRASDGSPTCDSVTFPVSGGEYSRVCGRIKAYQWGQGAAFFRYNNGHAITFDGSYVGGISVTHGSPRQHIWTFAVGGTEGNPTWPATCPCDASRTIRVPPFVGNDYFCESGINEPWDRSRHFTFHSNDTLWDGKNCLSSSTCCSLHNPPYFVKQLPTPTNEDIEARMCMYGYKRLEDIAVELIELYVQ